MCDTEFTQEPRKAPGFTVLEKAHFDGRTIGSGAAVQFSNIDGRARARHWRLCRVGGEGEGETYGGMGMGMGLTRLPAASPNVIRYGMNVQVTMKNSEEVQKR